jgi:hypothetical protein
MKTTDIQKHIEEIKLRPEVAVELMAAHAARLELLLETAQHALAPFAKAHQEWHGGNAREYFADKVCPSDYRIAADIFARLG